MLSQIILETAFELVKDNLSYAYWRWQDERDYEDIEDYSGFFRTPIEKNGGKFLKMTKRPFGFQAEIEGRKLQFYANAENLGVKHI